MSQYVKAKVSSPEGLVEGYTYVVIHPVGQRSLRVASLNGLWTGVIDREDCVEAQPPIHRTQAHGHYSRSKLWAEVVTTCLGAQDNVASSVKYADEVLSEFDSRFNKG